MVGAAHCQSLVFIIVNYNCCTVCCIFQMFLCNLGTFTKSPLPMLMSLLITRFLALSVYSFGCGHFVSAVSSHNLPCCVKLACNQYESGCAVYWKFTSCTQIFGSGINLLHHIHAPGDVSQIQIHGYINSFFAFQGWQFHNQFLAASIHYACSAPY